MTPRQSDVSLIANPPDSPGEWIVRIDQQMGLRGNVRAAGDARHYPARTRCVTGLEYAAENALLAPDRAGSERTVGSETGELGAGTGAARGAIVGQARTQNEVPGIDTRGGRSHVDLDVIDIGTLGAGDAPGRK